MSVSDFAARSREHTFRSGRTVLVRETLSYMHLLSRMQRDDEDGLADLFAAWTGGEKLDGAQASAALRLNDVLVQEIVLEPRVLVPDVDAEPDGGGYGTEWCWINDFDDQELTELVELASQGVGQLHTFPGDDSVDDDRGDSEVLEDKPKPAPRPRKRKR